MRSIGMKFGIVFGVAWLALAGVLIWRTWANTTERTRAMMDKQAALALEFDLAIRDYVGKEIRPVVRELIGEDEFIPETMSTSFVARSIFERVRKKFPDSILKFSSDNPRNPANQAGPDELAMIDYFNANPHAKRQCQRWHEESADQPCQQADASPR